MLLSSPTHTTVVSPKAPRHRNYMGCPGISLNVILIVSVSIILDEIRV